MYSLEQLRGFVAVAEELHFGRAAERLRMTQPPLSRAIQKLEREVGVTLFERGSHGVVLTPAGGAFLTDARRMLVAAHAARETARRVASGAAGELAVGFTAMAALSVIPHVLRECDEHLPGVDTTLHELVSGAQFDGLSVGDLDLGLARTAPPDPDLESRLVHRERLVAAIPSSHPLAADTAPLAIGDLDGVDMIDYDRVGAGYFAHLVSGLLADVRPRSRQRVTQIHTMLALVGAERGVAIVPEAATALRIPGVSVRALAERPHPSAEIRVVWHPRNPNAALHRALASLPSLRPWRGHTRKVSRHAN